MGFVAGTADIVGKVQDWLVEVLVRVYSIQMTSGWDHLRWNGTVAVIAGSLTSTTGLICPHLLYFCSR